uniref:Chromo domain-containing protein n=1 Tax=Meloidogyne incognita TaxID=6306 RepID=A0A914NHB1_MELIC
MPREEEDVFDKEISADSSDNSDEDEYEVEKIVSDEWDAKKQKRFYWVKWVGYPSSQNTLEPEENLKCPALLEAYKAKKERKRKEVYEQDSGDEDFIVPDDQSPIVDLKSNKEHRHEKTVKIKGEKKSTKYSDQSTSSSTLSRLLKNMKRDNNFPRSSYSSSFTHEKKNRVEKNSSSTSSKDSSRSSSLRPNSESSTLKNLKNKRKILSTVDEEEGDKTIPKKKKVEKTEETVIVKRISLSPTSDEDSNIDEESPKKPSKETNQQQVSKLKTSSIIPNSSSSSSSFADLYQKFKKKKSVEDAKKLKKQKSEEEEKLEKKKRIEKFKKEALQEYLSSQSDTDDELSSTNNNFEGTTKIKQKKIINSEDSSVDDGAEENSDDKEKEENVGRVERTSDDNSIDTSPDEQQQQFISDQNEIVEERNEEKICELNIGNNNEEQRVGDDSVNDELVKGLEEIDRLFEYKVENITATENQMPKRQLLVDGDDSDNGSQETDQMDLQIPPTPKSYATVDSFEDELDLSTNGQMGVYQMEEEIKRDKQRMASTCSSTGKRSATIPSTASDDFYQRLLDGTIDDWENQSELTDEILASIPMEEMDKPDYEPLEPISVDSLFKGKVRVFNSPNQKNGFDLGWKVESILGIAAEDDDMCIVKFIGFSTPQKLPYELVREHALQDYVMYHQWIGCKINPTLRGAYWDKKLLNPSSWMTEKALTSFKQWKEEEAARNIKK